MTFLLGGMLGGGAAAGTATAAVGTGFSFSSIMSGLATVGGIVASIASGNAEAANLRMQANDAEAEKGFETLQGVDRRRSLLKDAQEAVTGSDVAYAGSGLDLSFGSAAQVRQNAYRQTDLAQQSNDATTGMRLDRLTERAANLREMAKRAKRMGLLNAFTGAFSSLSSMSG